MSTSLELFVLAMVRQGLATPYELKTKAGLSLGSTVPVLARLEKDLLVKASEKGARRSRKFSITAKGTKTLTNGWAEQLAMDHTDLDSILRIASLAWLHGDIKACQEFMKRSAKGLHDWAGSLRAEADRLAARVGKSPDGDTFVWLRTYCEAARAETDAEALVELSDRISRKVEKKRRTTTTPRRQTR
jgi:DNA-binding PadR family transcriptional regulator